MLQTGYGGQYGVGMTATGATVVIIFGFGGERMGKKDWQRKQSFPGGEGPDDRPWDWPLWVLWREKWRSSFIAIE
ncbi:hypothetical protein BDV33DRAFT_195944 [Aspergillus novoparasiticus]|uniref:Uncharacterized protein n=1 Tax=Aspergillus novoparasiticus TaxID=986946 RepID=A0A5N6EAK4_9EURO|nr:hypothetical protein BDV33DRAFT_195944 [Aspergillus novoparasiticus]